jgi:hypothetical protein
MAARANRTAAAKAAAQSRRTAPAKKTGPATKTARKTVPATPPSQADRPAPAEQTAPADRPAPAREPRALRLAAAAQGIEAVGLAVAAVFAAISTADGRSSSPANGAGLTVLVVIVAAGLAAIAVGLAKARPWSRVPAVLTQLCVIIAAVALLDGHHPEWGVPALALAAACLAGLFTPASLRALNRPPGQSPIKIE